MPWPVTINGNTYTLDNFSGFNYTISFPNIMNDISTVAGSIAGDRAAITAAIQGAPPTLMFPQGQCRLDYASTTSIRLSRFGGSFLWVAGVNRQIPGAGLTLASTGLAEFTLYYIYASLDGSGALRIEADTVNSVTNPDGVRVKRTDFNATLVGMVYTDAGGAFINTSRRRHVRSFYNRQPWSISSNAATASTTATSRIDLSEDLTFSFVSFADDIVDFGFNGNASNSTGQVLTSMGIDGVNASVESRASAPSGSANFYPVTGRATNTYNDGYHVAALRGFVTAGTGSWTGQLMGRIG